LGKTARKSAASPANRCDLTEQITCEQYRHAVTRQDVLRQDHAQNRNNEQDKFVHNLSPHNLFLPKITGKMEPPSISDAAEFKKKECIKQFSFESNSKIKIGVCFQLTFCFPLLYNSGHER
jgi:hypothetical protein